MYISCCSGDVIFAGILVVCWLLFVALVLWSPFVLVQTMRWQKQLQKKKMLLTQWHIPRSRIYPHPQIVAAPVVRQQKKKQENRRTEKRKKKKHIHMQRQQQPSFNYVKYFCVALLRSFPLINLKAGFAGKAAVAASGENFYSATRSENVAAMQSALQESPVASPRVLIASQRPTKVPLQRA